MKAIVFLVIVAVSTGLTNGQNDLTRVAGAGGVDVVEATVSQLRASCIFPNDHLFLRRAAYVISKDGTDANTYRLGFDGGIWQVNQTDFLLTKSSPLVSSYWGPIRSVFQIDWATVQWSDLRKPLYSGIAAMLTLIRVANGNLPRAAEQQAAFYQKKLFPDQMRAAYNFLQETKSLDVACATNNLDIAFLVDSSTSQSPEDFERAKEFAANVVGQFAVGPNDVRVAFVTFSTSYKPQFDFQRYTTTIDAQNAIRAVQKEEGGTDTHLALRYASDVLFTTQSGSRSNAARVAVIITDGQSDNKIDANKNAQQLRDKGIIVFVIGVGAEVDKQELNSLSTQPSCTHVQVLQEYSELDSLKVEIKEVSCRAPAVLGQGSYTYPCGKKNNVQVNTVGVTSIIIQPTNGIIRIYGSYNYPQPNEALKDFSIRANTLNPAVIYVTDTTRPLYLSIQSDATVAGECFMDYKVDVVPTSALRPNTNNICISNGAVRTCSALDILRGIYTVTQPNSLGFPSPCVLNQPGYYPHPFSLYRFIFCDNNGRAYLVDCPATFYYNDRAKDCVKGPPPTVAPFTIPTTPPTTGTPFITYQPPMTADPNNLFAVCTADNYKLGIHFFPYPQDETKYIMCTSYPGVGYLKDCAPDHKWNQVDMACTYQSVVADWTKEQYLSSPLPLNYGCKPGQDDNDIYYHSHPTDNTKYIQCDEFGDAFVKSCPDREVWNQTLMTCVPGLPKIIG